MSDPTVWHEFAHDPRDPSYTGLRAADADRDVVRRVLGDAYAEGRLDREEFDERTDAVATSRTLGELPALIDDLVPTTSTATALVTPDTVQARAVARFERQRREALWSFVSASVICWVIWFATGSSFPWPLFVMLGTGINVGRVMVGRQDIIAAEKRRIEKRNRKELEARGHRSLGHGDPHGGREPEEG